MSFVFCEAIASIEAINWSGGGYNGHFGVFGLVCNYYIQLEVYGVIGVIDLRRTGLLFTVRQIDSFNADCHMENMIKWGGVDIHNVCDSRPNRQTENDTRTTA